MVIILDTIIILYYPMILSFIQQDMTMLCKYVPNVTGYDNVMYFS